VVATQLAVVTIKGDSILDQIAPILFVVVPFSSPSILLGLCVHHERTSGDYGPDAPMRSRIVRLRFVILECSFCHGESIHIICFQYLNSLKPTKHLP
jgi:hypothetical protein